jgi:beta-galactosidase
MNRAPRSHSGRQPLAALFLALCACSSPHRAEAPVAGSVRERTSLDADWRFHKGDPEGLAAGALDYDVRPKVERTADGKIADAKPEETAQLVAASKAVLKPWILPSGNALIADAAHRHARPADDPGNDVSFVQTNFDDSAWQRVDLPHDWAIAGPFLADGPFGGMGRLTSWGIGWYRRKLDIPAVDKGRAIFLDVDGAMAYSEVWLNGHLVGGWPYGYNSWRLDLTPFVSPGGVNQLAIRLDNPPESSRWYPGGGLYRNVWLTKTNPVHVAHWGTHVTTSIADDAATIRLDVAIDNDGPNDAAINVETKFLALDADDKPIGPPVASVAFALVRVAAKSQSTTSGSANIAHPRLWGPPPTQQPNRYVAVTTLSRDGRVVDRYETPFGIRSLVFDANKGLIVNGERIAIHGVGDHADLGALGAAFNTRAAQRQLEVLQAMGANAVRFAHNPPAPELLELTDRMGFLVIDEIFDSWERGKTPLDFHLVFPDWHEPDLRAMLRRDRNHQSIMLWSIGNEVGEQYTGDVGAALARQLIAIVREEDATRPTITAMNWAKADMALPAAIDVIGLNYQGEGIRQEAEFEGTERIRTPPSYDTFHTKFPDKTIISTETASAFSSRGVYLFPVTKKISAPVRDGSGGDSAIHQVSAYELYAVDFGSSADKVFAALDQHPFVAGEFVWSGFDYLGEPTPYYSSRSSYSGIIDLAGFPKDRYWLYQSRWRPDLPMAHILPHWTWPGREGQVTPVHVFTSGDEGELFVNGVSQGRKKKEQYEYRLRWDDVVYAPGELRVETYKAGKPWATATLQTAGAPAQLEAVADRHEIGADGSDLSFITIRVLDAQGSFAPTAHNRIRFSIDGPAEIVATDNGDATDFESFALHERKAFNGLCLVIVRSMRGHVGEATLRAEADGLSGAGVALQITSAIHTASRER